MRMELLDVPEVVAKYADDTAAIQSIKVEHGADEVNALPENTEANKAQVKQGKSERHYLSKLWLRSLLRNIDPIFYLICCVSLVVLVSSFSFVLWQHEKIVAAYMKELTGVRDEIEARIANSDSDSLTSALSRNANSLKPVDEKPMVQPQQAALSESISPRSAKLTDEALNKSSAVSSSALKSSADEVSDLELLLAEKTLQVEQLALENHELRLQLTFGDNPDLSPLLNRESNEFTVSETDRWETLEKALVQDSLNTNPENSDAVDSNEPLETLRVYTNTDIKDLISEAQIALKDKNLKLASEKYKLAVQQDPSSRAANTGLAASATELGNIRLATDRYRHLLTLNPNDQYSFTAMLNLAEHNSMIETELLAHIELSGKSAALYSIVGHYFGRARRWEDAREMYVRALASSGNSAPPADYFYNLAVSYQRLGNTGTAVEYYRKALNSTGGATFDRSVVQSQLHALADSRSDN